MLKADSPRNRLKGIGLVSVCYVLFSLLDGSAKWLVTTALPVIVVVWMRFLVHAVISTVVFLPTRGFKIFRTQHWRWHIARAVMFVAMTAMNFWALQYLQLTVTASIFFSSPLLIALASSAILGEKLDRGRWAAVIAGFAGVLIVVRPGSAEFHPAMILSIINALMYAAFLMMTRRLAAYDPPETIQYLPAIGAAILLTPFGIAAWETPNGWVEWTVVCLLGVFGGVGHYLLAVAHRYAPSHVIAPFLYQQVIYMALFGFIVFGDVPSPSLWLGAAIVIASGLYLFARESSRA